MSAVVIEMLLIELGATIDYAVFDGTAQDVGQASFGNLRIRYRDSGLEIGWKPEFDRWANSTDWESGPPETAGHLRAILEEAEQRGALGEATEPDLDMADWRQVQSAMDRYDEIQRTRHWIDVPVPS